MLTEVKQSKSVANVVSDASAARVENGVQCLWNWAERDAEIVLCSQCLTDKWKWIREDIQPGEFGSQTVTWFEVPVSCFWFPPSAKYVANINVYSPQE